MTWQSCDRSYLCAVVPAVGAVQPNTADSPAAAGVLASYGSGVADAFEVIEQARGLRVPDTEEQRRWLEGL